jgi:hypothetical protein
MVGILPAILYFATVGFLIRIEAKRSDVSAPDDGDVLVWPCS